MNITKRETDAIVEYVITRLAAPLFSRHGVFVVNAKQVERIIRAAIKQVNKEAK